MREILFRGKNIGNGEWVEGSLVTRRYNDTGEVFEAFIVVDAYPQTGVMNFGTTPVLISPSDGLCFRVDKDTICQFTGLLDKNGNKIWENDILCNCGTKYNPLCVVKLGEHSTNLGFYCDWKYEDIPFRNDILFWAKNRVMEVIGNVFDNANLLERE